MKISLPALQIPSRKLSTGIGLVVLCIAGLALLALRQPPACREFLLRLAPLSFVSFGGVNVIIPDLERIVVEQLHIMQRREFYELLGLGFAAPGPNMLFVGMLGVRIAGIVGGILALTLVMVLPSLITGSAARWWFRHHDSPLRAYLQAGLMPATVGIIFAATWILCHAVVTSRIAIVLCGVTVGVLLRTRLHPLVVLAVGGLVGWLAALP